MFTAVQNLRMYNAVWYFVYTAVNSHYLSHFLSWTRDKLSVQYVTCVCTLQYNTLCTLPSTAIIFHTSSLKPEINVQCSTLHVYVHCTLQYKTLCTLPSTATIFHTSSLKPEINVQCSTSLVYVHYCKKLCVCTLQYSTLCILSSTATIFHTSSLKPQIKVQCSTLHVYVQCSTTLCVHGRQQPLSFTLPFLNQR